MAHSVPKSKSPPTIRKAVEAGKGGVSSTTKTRGKSSVKREGNSAKNEKTASENIKSSQGIVIKELRPINPKVPYSRKFIQLDSRKSFVASQHSRLIKSFKKNVKGLFDREKEGLDFRETARLRTVTGNLKEINKKPAPELEISKPLAEVQNERKTKKTLLEEKRQNLEVQSKSIQKTGSSVGVRLEINKLIKKYPSDSNLVILSAILTTKDNYSTHRSITDRINSLYSALQQAGSAVINDYLTTYAVDILFDIYFFYLDVLRSKLKGDLKSANESDVESIRRDIRVLNILIDQKKLQKSISNVAQKLDGFSYPYVSLSPLSISKSYESPAEESDKKIGPGTVKLNKFLVKFYLNIFGQIPIFQPLAKKICEALPNLRDCRALIVNVNMDNAITHLNISKVNRARNVPKTINSVFGYGRQYFGKGDPQVNSATEARILLKTAQMVEEFSYISSNVEPTVIEYGYKCASAALPYYAEESEIVLRKISDIAAKQGMSFN